MMKSYLLLPFLLTGRLYLLSQNLSTEQVQEDLTTLQQRIQDYHPALDYYNPDFTKKTDSLISSIKDSSTLLEAYQAFSRVCAWANEGHFEIGTWQDEVHKGIGEDKEAFFPIRIRIVNQQIYVWYDLTEKGYFQKGDRILAINGKSDSLILSQLLQFIPTDGHIKTYGFHKASDNFPWFYYFYIEQPDSFEISYQPYQSEEIKTVTIEAQTQSQRKQNFKDRYPVDSPTVPGIDDFYTLEYEDNYAKLKLKSFDYRLVEKYELKAKDFYQKVFSEIKVSEVENLIIDLRGNTGGRNGLGEEIVPFILKSPKKYPFLIRSTSWRGKVKTQKVPKADKLAFQGKIYVLVDGLTYSAGATLARYLREFGEATIVGEETGTRYEGFVAGSARYVTLTHSRIRIGIPIYHKEFPKSDLQETQNRGLIPDREITLGLDDLLEGRDRILRYVTDQISKQ